MFTETPALLCALRRPDLMYRADQGRGAAVSGVWLRHREHQILLLRWSGIRGPMVYNRVADLLYQNNQGHATRDTSSSAVNAVVFHAKLYGCGRDISYLTNQDLVGRSWSFTIKANNWMLSFSFFLCFDVVSIQPLRTNINFEHISMWAFLKKW